MLETLPDWTELRDITLAVSREQLVFSLDLKAGRPMTASAAIMEFSPHEIADSAVAAGVRRMIVLDLTHVGVGEGLGTTPLCRRLHERHPEIEIISGGGVRGADDLRLLAEAGCDAALVASAFHDRRLTASDVAVTKKGFSSAPSASSAVQ